MTPIHIPLDHPIVTQIKEIIPEQWHDLAYIAGSAAAMWPEAYDHGGDVDVWILAPDWKIYGPLSNYFWDKYGTPVVSDDHLYIGGDFDKLYNKDRIQIMGGTYQTIQHVVDGFDISCHASSVKLTDGAVYTHPDYTPAVRILKWRDPRRTLLRGGEFAFRYKDRYFWTDAQTKNCAAAAVQDPSLRVSEGL